MSMRRVFAYMGRLFEKVFGDAGVLVGKMGRNVWVSILRDL